MRLQGPKKLENSQTLHFAFDQLYSLADILKRIIFFNES